MTTLLESCRIAPPPHTVVEQSLPLTFLDFIWLHFPPIRRLIFYELPDSSKPYFLQTLVPKLKESLSLTLKHFFPLAGKIVYPLNSEKKPEIRYRTGDSVSLTVSESSVDFDNLVGNHVRDADNFYDFIPLLSKVTDEESDQKLLEVVAVQVTLFLGRGVCIGLSTLHSVADAISMAGFIESWALINKNQGEDGFLKSLLPVFDRSLIKYPVELDSVFLEKIKEIPMAPPSSPVPTNRIRATYVFTQSEIKKLKDLALSRIPGLRYVSSFVVIAAYAWNCLAKSLIIAAEKDGDEPEFFSFGVDARARVDPPVPGNYFGNCLGFVFAMLQHEELVGEKGFFMATEAISKEINIEVIKNSDIFGGARNLGLLKNCITVSGSARLDLYNADFGWGKARKLESLSIDGETYQISLCKSRDCEGGLEIGVSLPKVIMDAFAVLFYSEIRGNECAVVASRL